eukprot:SAG22_NODE_33_length_27588_cov_104.174652_14_plen_132_part_00
MQIFFHNSWHLPDASKGELASVYEPSWLVLDGKDPTRILAQAQAPLFDGSKPAPAGSHPGSSSPMWMRGHPSTKAAPVVCNTAEVAFLEAAHAIAGGGPGADLFRVYFGGADAVVGTAVVRIKRASNSSCD